MLDAPRPTEYSHAAVKHIDAEVDYNPTENESDDEDMHLQLLRGPDASCIGY